MKLNEDNEYNAQYLAMLPQWKCHKVVRAGKISLMAADEPNGMLMIHAEPSNMPFAVPLDFLQRHAPERGGYLVVYEDGYLSYSPAEVFEAGYHALEPLGCSPAGSQKMGLKEAFNLALGKAEHLAFNYAHALPEGSEREQAMQFYHRVRMVTADGKGGYVGGNLINAKYIDKPFTNLIGATGDHFAVDHTENFAADIDLSAADFSDALMWLKEGRRVARAGWSKDKHIFMLTCMRHTHADSYEQQKIQFSADRSSGDWSASSDDMLSTDWIVVS